MHYKKIVHRDLKPENILIDTKFQVSISDFGSTQFDSTNNKHLIKLEGKLNFGTCQYNAPEIYLQTEYDGERADIFSCGILLFVLIVGKFPFKSVNKEDYYYRLFKKTNKACYWSKFPKVSNEFKDLFQNLCNSEPEKRLSIDEIFNHEWLEGGIKISEQIKNDLEERFRTLDIHLKNLREKKQRFKFLNNLFEDEVLYSINSSKKFPPNELLCKEETFDDANNNNNNMIAFQEECDKINSDLFEPTSSMLDYEDKDFKEIKIN